MMASQSIRRRLTVLTVIISFLVVISAMCIFIINHIHTYKNSLVNNLASVGRLVEANVRAPLLFHDNVASTEVLASLGSIETIKYAAIYDLEENLFSEYGESAPWINQQILNNPQGAFEGEQWRELSSREKGLFSSITQLIPNRTLVIGFPISMDQERLGLLYIGADTQVLSSQLIWFLWLSFCVLIATLFLSYMLANKFFGGLAKPLFSLTKHMREISANNVYLSADIPHENNEIGELIEGFNILIGTIKSRDDKLISHRLDLESRTQELSIANQSLESSHQEMERAMTSAESASRAKGDFLATMSHEIRTPLNGVLGMAQIMADTQLDNDQAYYVDTIQKSGNILLGLINDILDFSKIEAGMMELEQLNFDLVELVEDAAVLFSEEAKSKNLKLICCAPIGLQDYIVGDANRLRQVIINLLGNAIKFTSQGEVSLYCEVVSTANGFASIEIKVADTGVGISEDGKRKIFESFTQADSTTTRTYGGTGLGLSISQRIIQLMSGEIQLESKLGMGSTFSVLFSLPLGRPLKPVDEKLSNQPEMIHLENIFQGKSALIVEDIVTNQKVATLMLEKLGLSVRVANNGQEGVEMFSNYLPDLIMMDCQMPVMDGYEATVQIRNIEKAKVLNRTPIVALTANALQEDREKCLAIGMDGYLSKPFEFSGFRKVVLEHLEKNFDIEAANAEFFKAAVHEQTSCFDPEVVSTLKSICNDEEIYQSVIDAYLSEGIKIVSSIETAMIEKNCSAIATAAHALKSSSMNIGAMVLGRQLAALEIAAKQENFNSLDSFVAGVVHEYQAVIAELNI